jgi:hypothetical protein
MTKLDRIETKVDQLLTGHADLAARVVVLEKQNTHKHDRRAAFISGLFSLIVALITALSSCVMSGCSAPQVQYPGPAQVRDLRSAVVHIDGVDPALWKTYQGTGEFIGPHLVLTAGHMCSSTALLAGQTPAGDRFELLPLLDHDGEPDDTCLLFSLGYKADQWMTLASKPVQFGDHVWTMGWDYGEVFLVTEGMVGEPYGPGWLSSQIDTIGGDSGSALLNDRGEIVGVLSRGIYPVTLFVPLETLRADLAEVEN